MTRTRPAVLAALAAAIAVLSAAPPAGAKGVAQLKVCGPDGCIDRTRVALKATPDRELLLDAGMPVVYESVTRESFVRLKVGVGDGQSGEVFGRYTAVYLPHSGHLLSEDGNWSQLTPDERAVMRKVTAGVRQFPARRLHLISAAPTPQPTTPSAATTPVAAAAGSSGGGDGDGGGPSWPLIAGIAGALLAVAGGAAALALRRPAV